MDEGGTADAELEVGLLVGQEDLDDGGGGGCAEGAHFAVFAPGPVEGADAGDVPEGGLPVLDEAHFFKARMRSMSMRIAREADLSISLWA